MPVKSPVKSPAQKPSKVKKLPEVLKSVEQVDSLETLAEPKIKPKYTPVSVIFDLISVKGLSFAQAAKVLDITPQAVHQMAKRHNIPSKNALERYKSSRADFLASKGMELIESIGTDDIKKATAYQKVGMYGILYDKERLERGQSTANVEHAGAFDVKISDIDREINKLQGKLVDELVEGELIDKEIQLLEEKLSLSEEDDSQDSHEQEQEEG